MKPRVFKAGDRWYVTTVPLWFYSWRDALDYALTFSAYRYLEAQGL